MTNSISIDILRSILRYDPETGKLLWLVRPRRLFPSDRGWNTWNAKFAGKPAMTARQSTDYLHGAIFKKRFLAHRVAFALYHGYWPLNVDHIDGNKQNNTIGNLREVTRSENGKNQKIVGHNTSGIMGVHWNTARRRWYAKINSETKQLYLGSFKNKDDAIAARKAAENQYGFHQNHGRIG